MSVKITIRELQEQLPDLLDRAVEHGEEVIVQRNGKDYAVLVSAREWWRRMLGEQLDVQGSAYRLVPEKQARVEELLARQQERLLTRAERGELDDLLRECDEIMLRRAEVIESVG